MSRKIQINLPDGVVKRTMIAGMDSGQKWGHGLYLEIFCMGLGEFEKVSKERRAAAPIAAQKQTTKGKK